MAKPKASRVNTTIIGSNILLLPILFCALFAGCDTAPPDIGPDARVEVTASNYADIVTASSKPVILEFHATWCGPCLSSEPYVAALSTARPDILIAKIDIDQAPELAETFQVSSIPCFVFVKNGQEIGRKIGGVSTSSLESLVAKHFPELQSGAQAASEKP